MKNILVSLFLLFLTTGAFAEVQHLRLGRGKVIAYEHIVRNPQGPTLILLPGVNRSLESSDRAVRLLLEKGWNLLMPSLPAHPQSIAGLDKYETPYFAMNNTIRAKDFAADIEILAAELKVDKAIPITLSYSSSVGAFLNPKVFPHVIETVPLGTAMETDPEAQKNTETWENWLRLNPFMAPFWIRQFRDQAYSTHWSKVVDGNLKNNPDFYGTNPRVGDIKNGYVTIARAVEDFNFPDWDFTAETRTRDFVIAGSENPERLKNQVEVIKKYLASGKPVRVVVVEGAGHIMPTDKPALYVGVLNLLSTQGRQGSVQFAVVKDAETLQTLKWSDGYALERWLRENQR